jgi:hypothetical protein
MGLPLPLPSRAPISLSPASRAPTAPEPGSGGLRLAGHNGTGFLPLLMPLATHHCPFRVHGALKSPGSVHGIPPHQPSRTHPWVNRSRRNTEHLRSSVHKDGLTEW